ncbi:MAG: dihydroorotate dehydrogenase electron transfer subunit [Candidatus Margulisiibacteriota bacterium]|nr:dihydroorotate dehydrogenase electron transfer subunit [Candidatus Margulisiibacteriota bacterium]
MSIQEKCRILDHQNVAPNHFKLIISSSYISSHAEPGQFVNVRVSDGYDPLLRRPLSIHSASKKHKRFELLYEVVGKGTELLSKYSVGSELDILGPLGKGFKIDQKKEIAILVGGGMGVAPLLTLAEQMSNDKLKMTNKLFILIGAKNRDRVLCEKEFKLVADQVLVSTDNGSYGEKGLVSDQLLKLLNSSFGHSEFGIVSIYACGPKPMLKAITDIAFQNKIDCQVSMEQKMACGIGTCLGCVIKTKSGYQKVCSDGPVFKGNDIIWQD